MKKLLDFLCGASPKRADSALLLIRIFVGWVFVFAGFRKFMEPDAFGAGRFALDSILRRNRTSK